MAREMTPEEVRRQALEIQARAEKATPGIWRHEASPDGRRRLVMASKQKLVASYPFAFRKIDGQNLAFIASSRSDVPWLCEELLKMLAFLDGMAIPIKIELEVPNTDTFTGYGG